MRHLSILIFALSLISCSQTPEGNSDTATRPAAAIEEASEPGAPGLDRSLNGRAAPDSSFVDPEGEEVTLADFRGKPVLVNLWATWCAPCVKELPTLDGLAGKGAIDVLAISQDNGPQPSVVAFLDKLGVTNLAPYQDAGMSLSAATGAQILPTTILFDAEGKEVWRFVGDLDWTSAEAATLLSEVAKKSSPAGDRR